MNNINTLGPHVVSGHVEDLTRASKCYANNDAES